GSLSFSLKKHQETIDGQQDELCKIVWHGPSPHSAEDLVQTPQTDEQKELKEEGKSKLEQAKHFLQTILKDGPRPVKQCLSQAAEIGLARITTERAARQLGVQLTYYDPLCDK